MIRRYPGLNVQTPWAGLIASGKKTVETRFYPLPAKYIGRELLIVETPGPRHEFRRRPLVIVTFGESFRYTTRAEFYADSDRHLITAETKAFNWMRGRTKWGWPITSARPIKGTIPADFRTGIVFSRAIPITFSSSSHNCRISIRELDA